ncbi:hypothetical protein [Halorhabdus sp. BNX81]|uniref:hypothetical protein n=1 Tax=Halorhabdus sp. BNX81 TaxID=2980181 RepID=UPI0023DD60F4|nr:hypothetical protein [Halorhabdus sp. BNX81]WEL22456.1 HEAT repeats containing protein [Halorhabdus sp. BNX81]
MIEGAVADAYRLFAVLSAAGLVTTGTLLVAISVIRHYRDRYVESVIGDLRPEIVARATSDDPEWVPWITELSFVERYVLRRETRKQLESVSGAYRENISTLAVALDIDTRARRQLASDNETHRHRGLVTLLLLDARLDVDRAIATAETQYERAIIARHMQDSGDQSRAVELLVEPGEPLPGFALYTLYHIVRQNPATLIRETPAWKSWDTTLVVQLLSILRRVEWVETPEVTSWLRVCLSADSPAIRAGAVNALEPYISATGSVPPRLDIDSVLLDPSIRVRAAAFRQLSDVDDLRTQELIRSIADREPSKIGRHVVATELDRNHPETDIQPPRWSINWRAPWDLEWENQPLLAPEEGEAERREVRI